MRRHRLLAVCAALGALFGGRLRATAEQAPGAEPPPLYWRLKASVGYHYSRGDYTGSDITTIQYVPLVLTADVDRWRAQLILPYLHIDGPPGIIDGPSGPIETDGAAGGLGDLLLRGSYLLPLQSWLPSAWSGEAWVPYVDLIGLVKFPTASRADGLGTGEYDFGIETGLTWTIGHLTPFANAGYRFLGSPPGTHLDDVFTGSIGAMYQFLATLNGGLLLDYRQAPTEETGERLELVPFGSWTFIAPWSLDAYVSAGLANGSPDFGTGVQIGYTW